MKIEIVTWSKVMRATDQIADWVLNELKPKPNYIVGIPRGGLIPAVIISHKTNIPMISMQKGLTDYFLLVVDDICDTGKTFGFFNTLYGPDFTYATATIYYKKNLVYKPDHWVHIKEKDWVQFPWETFQSTKQQ